MASVPKATGRRPACSAPSESSLRACPPAARSSRTTHSTSPATAAHACRATCSKYVPSSLSTSPKLEVHFLGIGIRKQQTARLVFTSKVGPGIKATVVDLGNRFRLISQEVECIEPKPMPNLPVASALWVPQPTFEIGAGAWILAGGTHHSAFSYDITEEYWEDFAEITGIEYVKINKQTCISSFKQQLRNNEVYYMLNKALK